MYLSVILVNNVLECSLQLTFMFYNVSATLAYFGDYPITNGGSEKNKRALSETNYTINLHKKG